MNRTKASTRDNASAPQSLQALQSGINCLSLDQAIEAVRLAKLKLEDLKEVQASAVASLALANQDAEKERIRSSIFCIFAVTVLHCSRLGALLTSSNADSISPVLRLRLHPLNCYLLWSFQPTRSQLTDDCLDVWTISSLHSLELPNVYFQCCSIRLRDLNKFKWRSRLHLRIF